MHAVIWTSAGQRFALPTSAVVEVVPVVKTTPLAHGPPEVKGVFNYRGELIPLLDAARLLGQVEAELRMSTRILVVRTGHAKDDAAGDQQLIGLLVQQVLGSEELDTSESLQSTQTTASSKEFLGPVVLTPAGTVQLIQPEGVVIQPEDIATASGEQADPTTQSHRTQQAP